MGKGQFILGLILASLFGGLVSVVTLKFVEKKEPTQVNIPGDNKNFEISSFRIDSNFKVPDGLNFVAAARLVTPGVVHIKSTVSGSDASGSGDPMHKLFPDFFDRGPERFQATGSGVIISEDGLIATNYHVVENATNLEITLNDNRRYNADVIGTDPTTDLALLKINETNLPFVRFGDSDKLQIGEWVLAVGNPYELTSTVTAGIVSAKARNINILNNRERGIESFIQTDAAVNPGNSGGALVNLGGELIGINTAIATPTGTYTGYSFAVPVSLVQKVMGDLAEYGTVQRALLGISIQDVNADFAEQHKTEEHSGVYVGSVNKGSSAEDAGLREGDIIIKIDNNKVENVASLQEMVARKHPGDMIEITYRRDGKEKTVKTKLKNVMGDMSVVRKESTREIDGAIFAELGDDLKQKLNLNGGVQLKEIRSPKWKDSGIKESFIITYIDKKPVYDLEDLAVAISGKNGRYFLEGVYPNGQEDYFRINDN